MLVVYCVLDGMLSVIIFLLRKNVFQKMQMIESASIRYGK